MCIEGKMIMPQKKEILIRKAIIILYSLVLFAITAIGSLRNNHGTAKDILFAFSIVLALIPQFHYINNHALVKYTLCFVCALIPFWTDVCFLTIIFMIIQTALFPFKRDKHVIIDLKKEGIKNDIEQIYSQINIAEFYCMLDAFNAKFSLMKQNAISGNWDKIEGYIDNENLHIIGNEKHLEKVCSAILGNRRAKIIVDMTDYC